MNKIEQGLQEALAFAKGEEPAARLTINGHTYVPEQQWQPIETAPRDDHMMEILLWVDGIGPRPAYFQDGQWISPVDSVTDYTDVTHWMPLPEPPK